MAKKDNTLLWVAGVAALYWFVLRPKTITPVTAQLPGSRQALLPGALTPGAATANVVNTAVSTAANIFKQIVNPGAAPVQSPATFTPQPPILVSSPSVIIDSPVTDTLPTADQPDQVPTALESAFMNNDFSQPLMAGLEMDCFNR